MENIKALKTRSDFLKIIAISSMFIDHVWVFFYPEDLYFRILWRLAFTIFAFQIAMWFNFTSNRKKYISRMFVFGLISQIPYFLAFDNGQFNIILTFTLALLALYFISEKKFFLLPVVIVPLILFDFEYSFIWILWPLIFYYFREYKLISLALFSFLIFIAVEINYIHYIQYYSIFWAILCLFMPYKNYFLSIPRNFFYIFYPWHLILLLILQNLIDK